MDSNTHSSRRSERFAALAAAINDLDREDLDRLTDTTVADDLLALRPLVERLEGQWHKRLAVADARGAAGADQDRRFGSTAGWLRARLRMRRHGATEAVRTARALFCGPLPQTARAVRDGELSVAHAEVLAAGAKDLPDHVAADAEPTLLQAARRLDPTGLRRTVAHLRHVADPDGADRQAQRRYERRGIWVAPTLDHMVAVGGQLDPEAGQTLLAALEPLTRPADANDTRSGSQRTADALTELGRRSLEGGQLPRAGGVRPQLNVIVDLASLHRQPGAVGGDGGGVGALSPQTCQRLACDAAITRVLVTRGPLDSDAAGAGGDPDHDLPGPGSDPNDEAAEALRGRLQTAMATLPRSWAAPPPRRSTWAAPPGSSPRPNARPWPSATAAACSLAATARWGGARPIMSGTGWTAAPPT
jgi:Domain of unknown function (DUF222)